MDLTNILLAAQQPDVNVRSAAEQQLKQIENTNFTGYVTGLAAELQNESKPSAARQLAGIQLKNSLYTKNEQQNHVLQQRWLMCHETVRTQTRNILLQTLASPLPQARSTAAQVIAKIAGIEVPRNFWQDLIPTIVNNITTATNPHLKQASFEALGYVCEEVPEHLQAASSQILNAISTGMRAEETNNDIKYAATQALANSLEFVRSNFANPTERNIIMQMIFSVTVSTDVRVRTVAYSCLVEIANLYYECLPEYIATIYNLTSNALQKEEEDVALQAVEFWSTVCDEEIILLEELADAQENNKQPDRPCHNFIQAATAQLVPILLQCLTKQHDDLENDDWNIAMAAGTCLGLCAKTAKDHILQFVLPFVQQNITNADWHFREAATLSFGCVLEGPDADKLKPLVSQALPLILNQIKDPNALVKDTAAWTIGRVCDLVPDVIDAQILPHVMNVFLEGLRDVPKVASNICWAIHNLASYAETAEDGKTGPLSPFFQPLMTALLQTTERGDVAEGNLLASAYEAINVLISTAAPDTYNLVGQMIPTLLSRLTMTLNAPALTAEDKEKTNEVQALLCGALQVIVTKLDDSVVLPHADALMTLFVRVLESKNATVHEEALMAIGAVANRVGPQFEKYISVLKPYLLLGLQNVAEYKVCTVAVGLIGDITRALETQFIPLGDDVMKVLLEHLQNPSIERDVKPHIISCLGDIALAVGGYFERYLSYVMPMLAQASAITFEGELDYNNIEYLQQLRESILEAYTGILQGLSQDGKANSFGGAMDKMVVFFDTINADANREERVLCAAVGLIGDLASRLGNAVRGHLNRPSVKNLVEEALALDADEDTSSNTVDQAKYARSQLADIGLTF